MSFRTASTTYVTSGAQHLVQSAYVDTNNRITSFTVGDTKVEKWLKNDYSAVGYLKIPGFIMLGLNANSNAFYKSTDGANFTVTTSTGFASNSNFGANGIFFKNAWYVIGYTGSYVLYKSTDNGANWSSVLTVNATTKFFATSTALFAYSQLNAIFKRTTDGTTWADVATLSSATGMTLFGNTIVASQGYNLVSSTDDGVTFGSPYYPSPVNVLGYSIISQNIMGIEKITVGGQDRIYMAMSFRIAPAYITSMRYITSVPVASNFTTTVVSDVSMGASMTSNTEVSSSIACDGLGAFTFSDATDTFGGYIVSYTTGASQGGGTATNAGSCFINKQTRAVYGNFLSIMSVSQAQYKLNSNGGGFTDATSSFLGLAPLATYGRIFVGKPQ
jgi:hypothetical protein